MDPTTEDDLPLFTPSVIPFKSRQISSDLSRTLYNVTLNISKVNLTLDFVESIICNLVIICILVIIAMVYWNIKMWLSQKYREDEYIWRKINDRKLQLERDEMVKNQKEAGLFVAPSSRPSAPIESPTYALFPMNITQLQIQGSFDLLDLQLILLDHNLSELLYWAKLLIICLNTILLLSWFTCYQCLIIQKFRKEKWTDPLFSDDMLVDYTLEQADRTIPQRIARLLWCPK